MQYDPNKHCIVTVGGSEGIDIALRALINPGDEAILMNPSYVAYEPGVTLAGGVPVLMELKAENEFKITPEDLEKVITDKTKVLLLNYPNNPTGAIMTKEDLDFWNIRGVNVHDYYLGITDAANMDDDNIMIVNTYLSSMDNVPDYIKNTYSLVYEYQNFLIYVSDTNRLDGVTGYVDNEKSKDYCYSYGYELAGGEMNSEGGFEVIGSDDYVLSSPRYGEAQGELTLSMNYETDSSTESVGRLEVIDCNSGEVICDENIVSNANQLIIDGVDLSGRNIALKVYMNANEPITIYSFEFDRGIND